MSSIAIFAAAFIFCVIGGAKLNKKGKYTMDLASSVMAIQELRAYIVAAGSIAAAAAVMAKLRATCRAFAAEYGVVRLGDTLVAGPVKISLVGSLVTAIIYDGESYAGDAADNIVCLYKFSCPDFSVAFRLSAAEYTSVTRLFGLPPGPYYINCGPIGKTTCKISTDGWELIANGRNLLPYKPYRSSAAYCHDGKLYFGWQDIGTFSNLRRMKLIGNE